MPKQIREHPPFYLGLRAYPKRWWKKQHPFFFPRWRPELKQPRPADPWFDRDEFARLIPESVITADQYHPAGVRDTKPYEHRSTDALRGERGLVCAMIVEAIDDLRIYHHYRRKALENPLFNKSHAATLWRNYRSAKEWMWEEDDREHVPYSFSWCCAELGISAYWVQDRCRKYAKAAAPPGGRATEDKRFTPAHPQDWWENTMNPAVSLRRAERLRDAILRERAAPPAAAPPPPAPPEGLLDYTDVPEDWEDWDEEEDEP